MRGASTQVKECGLLSKTGLEPGLEVSERVFGVWLKYLFVAFQVKYFHSFWQIYLELTPIIYRHYRRATDADLSIV